MPGHVTAPAAATACDSSGHCATRLSSFDPVVIIESPGIAYDPDGLQSMQVLVNGVALSTIPLGGTNVEASWSAGWQPAAVGAYTVTARMTDQGNNVLTDTLAVQAQPARRALACPRERIATSGTHVITRAAAGCASARITQAPAHDHSAKVSPGRDPPRSFADAV